MSENLWKSFGIHCTDCEISFSKNHKLKILENEFHIPLSDKQVETILDLSVGFNESHFKLFIKWTHFFIDKSDDFIEALLKASKKLPSLLVNAEFEFMQSDIRWNDIIGYQNIKKEIEKFLYWPIEHKDIFDRIGLSKPSGILLYGPSGNGKTMIVHAISSDHKLKVLFLKGPEIFSKYFGETEEIIRNLFKTAKKISPCIVFIDELDAFAEKRSENEDSSVNDRIVSCFLNEMDGIENRRDIVLIACTSRKDLIDEAILRPGLLNDNYKGRIDKHLFVDYPSEADRKEFYFQYSDLFSFDENEFVEISYGLSFRQIKNCIRDCYSTVIVKSLLSSKFAEERLATR